MNKTHNFQEEQKKQSEMQRNETKRNETKWNEKSKNLARLGLAVQVEYLSNL